MVLSLLIEMVILVISGSLSQNRNLQPAGTNRIDDQMIKIKETTQPQIILPVID